MVATPHPRAELVLYCVGHQLARQKIPERLELVERLPRNATRKVLKNQLVDRFA